FLFPGSDLSDRQRGGCVARRYCRWCVVGDLPPPVVLLERDPSRLLVRVAVAGGDLHPCEPTLRVEAVDTGYDSGRSPDLNIHLAQTECSADGPFPCSSVSNYERVPAQSISASLGARHPTVPLDRSHNDQELQAIWTVCFDHLQHRHR